VIVADPVAEYAIDASPGGVARRRLKAFLGWLVYGTGLYRRFFRERALIALFHRIDDTLPGDPITCSEREFKAYLAFFSRYFIVVSLGELVERVRRGDDISRHLAVTFDDGYRDNAEVAALALRERGMPATFFIATGFIGTDRVAPWDARHGRGSRWMSWAQVRDLHAQGFEIGAHTVNHLDLGVVAGEQARDEVLGSRRHLEAEIGVPVLPFSYPFGRPDALSEQNRAMVRELGFSCCVSAFGGAVRPGTDVFHLNRSPVSPWYLSPYQFGFEALRAS
jgi:peptidoglycan/xylan/chitin deacetylase (PgdA/CDA1 family)